MSTTLHRKPITTTSLQDRLSKWPQRLPQMGPANNDLLAFLEPGPREYREMKANGLAARLGVLIAPNALAYMHTPAKKQMDAIYAITQKGRDYLTLLRHHGFLPPAPDPDR